ncbi:MAG TPA: class I SAM-dependent methyltransferase [Jatrophihabitans sp.]|nr:class I SAM-dependent methyltransferase [Jatrophihabitans sp.]
MPEDFFGADVAPRYDARLGAMGDPAVIEPTVDFLVEHARGGAALELGIGTGRIAVPLHQRGVPVHGIDLSEAMLAELRAKPGAEGIDVAVGDFAHTTVEGRFTLTYLVFNTIQNLTSQGEQVACFRNVADHLETGGRFVIEVRVPDLQRLPKGETCRPIEVRDDYVGFDEIDVAEQRMVSHHLRLHDGQFERHSVPFRYVWPAELDLMAQLAGMRPIERWADWHRAPFTSKSGQLVAVWEKR